MSFSVVLGLTVLCSGIAMAQQRVDFASFDAELEQELKATSVPEALVGVIYPKQRFLLALAASGLVDRVLVKEGDYVAKGTQLITLEQSVEALELQRLEKIKSDIRLLDATRRRLVLQAQQVESARALYQESRSISRDELNHLVMAEIALEGEVATLEMEQMRHGYDVQIAKALLEQRTLYAPVAGYITQIRPKMGEWAQAGDPVIELVDSSINYIRINVSDKRAAQLQLGQTVWFEVEGERAEGQVSFVSPVADPASGLVETRIEFANPDNRYRPGLKAVLSL